MRKSLTSLYAHPFSFRFPMRFLLSTIALTAVALSGRPAAAAALQQAAASSDTGHMADTAIVGRVIPCEGGHIGTFDCRNVELLAYLPAGALGGATGFDIWGWTDSTTGREFVAVGGPTGTAFVEVSDPVNPKYLGLLPPHNGVKTGGAESVKIYRNHAFVAFESTPNGLQIFDLTQLRDVKNAPVVFQETAHYGNFANAHTITMDELTGFAYAAGVTSGGETCGRGLHIINVSTPTRPTFAGCYTNMEEGGLKGGGYIHDALCTIYRGPDQQYRKQEICLASAGSAVVIVDVTDKKNPKTISTARYPNVGYTHQGWFTKDQRYFFIDDEYDERAMAERRTRTIVFDMSDLDDPVLLTEFFNTTPNTDHNLYIRGRYMYQANYGAGIRILDVSNPKKPQEKGFLSNIGEAWTNFPFFKREMVAVSTDRGLFLVRLRSR